MDLSFGEVLVTLVTMQYGVKTMLILASILHLLTRTVEEMEVRGLYGRSVLVLELGMEQIHWGLCLRTLFVRDGVRIIETLLGILSLLAI